MTVLRRAWEDLVTVSRHVDGCRPVEALLHPSIPALWTHRVAHVLHRRSRTAARFLAGIGRLLSGGIEIHPNATLGRRLFIDHGTGVVIGETAVVGDDVTLCQQVTLGAVGWWRDNERGLHRRRHPRLGDRVTAGANATLLGPLEVGDGAVIGAQALVVCDVPAGAEVTAPSASALPAVPRSHEKRNSTRSRTRW